MSPFNQNNQGGPSQNGREFSNRSSCLDFSVPPFRPAFPGWVLSCSFILGRGLSRHSCHARPAPEVRDSPLAVKRCPIRSDTSQAAFERLCQGRGLVAAAVQERALGVAKRLLGGRLYGGLRNAALRQP
jgi:hypothetical protein